MIARDDRLIQRPEPAIHPAFITDLCLLNTASCIDFCEIRETWDVWASVLVLLGCSQAEAINICRGEHPERLQHIVHRWAEGNPLGSHEHLPLPVRLE